MPPSLEVSPIAVKGGNLMNQTNPTLPDYDLMDGQEIQFTEGDRSSVTASNRNGVGVS